MRAVSRLIAVLLAMVAVASLAARALGADSPPARVVLVLDASGSMWGQIEERAKIEIARGVIRDILKDWPAGMQVGLMAYGHRHKGDCADIEMLVPVGPADTGAVQRAVDAIKPKGKTPLSDAVRLAAETLRFEEEPATVILVTDGLETCERDPCALSAALKSQGVDLTVHVVGFDLQAKEQAQVACIAKNTGGRFLAAADAGELSTAVAEAVRVTAAPDEAPAAAAEPAPPPEPAPAVEPAIASGLHLTAVLVEGDDAIRNDLSWSVYAVAPDAAGKRKRIERSGGAQPSFRLAAGRYLVEVEHGHARAALEVEVPEGEGIERTLVLNAGYLRLLSVAVEGAEPLTEDLRYTLYLPEPDASGKRERLTYTTHAQPLLPLPAGAYVVEVTHGEALKQVDVTVEAGELTEETVVLGVGYLRLASVAAEGLPPLKEDLDYYVFAPEPDLSGERERITRTGTPQPLVRLPAGRYFVQVKHGAATADAEVEIKAGQLTEQVLALNVGYLRVSTTRDGKPVKRDLQIFVYGLEKSLDGKQEPIAYLTGPQPLFKLPAGRYRLLVRHERKVEKEIEIEIEAGKLNETTIAL